MRKIEQQMLDAIKARRNWAGGNTQVSVEPVVTRVFLHGNHIATVRNSGTGLDVSLAGWNTATTRSRLSAIIRDFMIEPGPDGCGVSTKLGQPRLHDALGKKDIDERGWHSVHLAA